MQTRAEDSRRQEDDLEGAELVVALLALRGDHAASDVPSADPADLTVGG
jgi:hypothetical protein